jgi:hypothetical protein
MLEQAIAKIKTEMEQNASKVYIRVIGDFLLHHLESNPDDAQQILTEGKTIAKSLEAVRKEAEKHKEGSCAVLSDAEAFPIVLEYFGINPGQIGQLPSATPAVPALTPNPSVDFDVSLDELLKG